MDIPNRALFKSSEVCEIASVQPFVLRSWETEFPDLGVTKGTGARIYRRNDVERVLKIKQLVFADGLTMAGVRRRIEAEAPIVLEEESVEPMKQLLGRNARQRLGEIKEGLQAIIDLLSGRPGETRILQMTPPSVRRPARAKAPARAAKPARRKAGRSRR